MKNALILIPEKIKDLLETYSKDLEETWTLCGDEPLNISFSAKIGFDKYSKPVCEVGISFVKEKVKDSRIFNWNDKQDVLFKDIKGMDERLKKDHTSMTISSLNDKSVTLGNKETKE